MMRAPAANSRRRLPRKGAVVAALTLLAFVLFPRVLSATTLEQLTLDALVAESELVFTGSVESVHFITESELVYSVVRFNVENTIKGEYAGATLELRFLGGNDGSVHTEVAGQFIPLLGAHGVWFVEDTTLDLVNPLTGWSQGYFPIVANADGSLWLDFAGHPDYGLLQPIAPLAGKMRDMNFSDEQIQQSFPTLLKYPLNDFVRAIDAIAAEQGD